MIFFSSLFRFFRNRFRLICGYTQIPIQEYYKDPSSTLQFSYLLYYSIFFLRIFIFIFLLFIRNFFGYIFLTFAFFCIDSVLDWLIFVDLLLQFNPTESYLLFFFLWKCSMPFINVIFSFLFNIFAQILYIIFIISFFIIFSKFVRKFFFALPRDKDLSFDLFSKVYVSHYQRLFYLFRFSWILLIINFFVQDPFSIFIWTTFYSDQFIKTCFSETYADARKAQRKIPETQFSIFE